MILGFTGARSGPTGPQLETLRRLLDPLPTTAMHGGAGGADEAFDDLLLELGMELRHIHVLPGERYREEFWVLRQRREMVAARVTQPFNARRVYMAQDPLQRNRLIAAECNRLIACPAGSIERMRGSGTWSTIRYAIKERKSVTIIRPDGTKESRNG